MRMRKEGDVTFIKEVSVDVMIKLTNLNENENNENPDVFDSATMKDKVHSLAKQTGVSFSFSFFFFSKQTKSFKSYSH